MPTLTHEERIGTTLNEKYRLDGLLGRGGMGAVFAAQHLWTGRPVAVKMLNPEFASRVEMARGFLREARMAAGLKHPNVVDVLDMGSDHDAVYIVLERLNGTTLGELLDASGAQTPACCASILVPVMHALTYAHEQGVVHRDLKPDNVFISTELDGGFIPKLVDFGIAKVYDAADRSVTHSGAIIGTPQYMSPEQSIGADDLGPQADVWSMGVVWYECLSGVLPFDGPNATAIILGVVSGVHVPLGTLRPDLPPALCEAIEGALRVERADRYPDMRSLTDAVVAACESEHIARVPRIDLSHVGHARPATPPIGSSFDAVAAALTPPPRRGGVPAETMQEAQTTTSWSKAPTVGPGRRRSVVGSGVMFVVLAALAVSAFGARRASRRPPPFRNVPAFAAAATAHAPRIAAPPSRPMPPSGESLAVAPQARAVVALRTVRSPSTTRRSARSAADEGVPASPQTEAPDQSPSTSSPPLVEPPRPHVRGRNNAPITTYE